MADPEPHKQPDSGRSAQCWRALGYALTGRWLDTPASAAGLTPQAVVDWLDEQGWSADHVQHHRVQCQDDETPWPHTVEPELRGSLGAAQFHSLVAELRQLLGVSGLVATRRQGPPTIGPDDRRLLADVPPHHGH